MFNILNHEGNANQYNPDIPPHTSQNCQDQKFRGQKMLERMWRKTNILPLLVGFQAGKNTLEISLLIPQKSGHSTTEDPDIPLLGIYPEAAPKCNKDT